MIWYLSKARHGSTTFERVDPATAAAGLLERSGCVLLVEPLDKVRRCRRDEAAVCAPGKLLRQRAPMKYMQLRLTSRVVDRAKEVPSLREDSAGVVPLSAVG